MPQFQLSKWYFDCITENGDVFIGYSAKVHYGWLRLSYGATLFIPQSGPLQQRQSMLSGEITNQPEAIGWHHGPLGVSGTWAGKNTGDRQLLYDGKEGSIAWQCFKPNARVTLQLSGKPVRGLGYAERLDMTVPPWKLPFHELRWGRFIGDDPDRYLVWIDWRGRVTQSWAWAPDGSHPGDVREDTVAAGSWTLRLGSSSPIRYGNVAHSVFGAFRFLARFLPGGLRNIGERKFFRPAELTQQGSACVTTGATISEVVTWG